MENMKELNLNEMEEAVGGRGGSSTILPEKEGMIVYKIARGDTLGKIARRYGTSVQVIAALNPTTIRNINDITAGYYIYIPE